MAKSSPTAKNVIYVQNGIKGIGKETDGLRNSQLYSHELMKKATHCLRSNKAFTK